MNEILIINNLFKSMASVKGENPFVKSVKQRLSFEHTSNNQSLEKCVRCVLLLYNWCLRACFFF